MRSLYEIDQAILACTDTETGEVVDIDALIALDMERTAKIENVALYVKNLESEAKAIKEEADALTERQKAKEVKAARLRAYLSEALGGQPMETARVKLTFRKSTSAVVLDADELMNYLSMQALEQCIKRPAPTPIVSEIKKILKAGQAIPGAALVDNQNLQIK